VRQTVYDCNNTLYITSSISDVINDCVLCFIYCLTMSKHSGGKNIDHNVSDKKQKLEEDSNNKEDEDGEAGVDIVRCSECNHKPCLWLIYGDEIKEHMTRKVQELEASISDLNERRSKTRNAGYTLISQLYRGFIHHRKKHPKCVVDAVREFMPAVEGNEYTGFRP